MQIVVHALNHADVPDVARLRVERAVRKLGPRLRRASDATVRFTAHGPRCRVEVELRAPRVPPLVAVGEGWRFEDAAREATERLDKHVERTRSQRERRIRRAARDTARGLPFPPAAEA